ncbi:diacylglycerol kinase [Oceanobacter mangrovi]|uniref:diacylglycerol kinase n=1 Tax=Oceanobacter mangrovi TaxID=2862510 RepID=UPI001C8D40B2|nr:diacylglycerol kinase [Oceanobacter mangrovi]
MLQKATGLKRFYYASRYSWQGLKAAYNNEPAFRYELWAGLALVPASFMVAQSALQWALLITSWLLILVMELINTAIEAVVDRAGKEYNPMAGLAKDLGSAAVTVSIMICTIFWLAILIDNSAS